MPGKIEPLVDQLAGLSRQGLAASKAQIQAMEQGMPASSPELADAFLSAHDSADHLEGLRAFREKRKPNF